MDAQRASRCGMVGRQVLLQLQLELALRAIGRHGSHNSTDRAFGPRPIVASEPRHSLPRTPSRPSSEYRFTVRSERPVSPRRLTPVAIHVTINPDIRIELWESIPGLNRKSGEQRGNERGDLRRPEHARGCDAKPDADSARTSRADRFRAVHDSPAAAVDGESSSENAR